MHKYLSKLLKGKITDKQKHNFHFVYEKFFNLIKCKYVASPKQKKLLLN